MKRRLLSLLLAIVLVLGLFPAAALADTDLGAVRVIVENTTYSTEDGAPWDGTLLDTNVALTEASTMMSCIGAALTDYDTEGLDSGYISSIHHLAAFDGGLESGWMGTLNDWFVNAGFDSFTVADGTLCAGDEIRVMYTCTGYGADLGGGFGTNQGYLSTLSASSGSLSPVFDKDTPAYTLTVPSGVDAVDITATAENKNDQVTVSIGSTEYRRGKSVPVADDTQITVACGVKTYTVTVVQESAQPPVEIQNLPSAWPSFRGNAQNNGVTSANTPVSAEQTELLWAQKLSTGWSDAPSPMILVDGSVITMCGSTLKRVNAQTGAVTASAEMAAATNWGSVPPTYGDGIIFCPLSNGTVQAFNAETLESLWTYTDEKGGQSQSPVAYDDGYVYVGFGYGKEYAFVCLDAQTGAVKWRVLDSAGFYWAGAVVAGDYVVVGNDSGKLVSRDKLTGEVKTELDCSACEKIRSSICYAEGKVWFTGYNAKLCWAELNADGTLGELNTVDCSAYGANSTSTPVVYNSLAYLGVGGWSGSKSVVCVDPAAKTVKWSVEEPAYPQCSVLLSTAYESTGYLYLYVTYNNNPGGINVIKAKTDGSEATQTTLYDAAGYEQYCICSVIAGADGTLYYKNDSGNIFALKAKSVAVTGISLDKAELTLTAGESAVLTATVEPDNATDKTVTWTSGNEAVATVEGGAVTAAAVGTTVITAKAGEQTAECVVTVKAPADVNVTLSGIHNAQINEFKLYAYTGGVKGEQNLLESVTPNDGTYEVTLPAGDYWIDGYDANEDCNGGLKLTVSEDSASFKIQRMYEIYATNSGWVQDTDYTINVTVTGADGNAREITPGQANSYGTIRTSCLFVVGDTVQADFTPTDARAADYLPATAKKAPTLNNSLTASIPQAYAITITAPAGSTIAAGTFGTYYIYSFADSTVTEDENGVTAVFRVPQTSGNHFYRVQHPDGVTYWNFTKWNGSATVNVTAEDLNLNSDTFTKDTVSRFDKNKYDMASIYLNANGQGYLDLDVGESFEFNVFRNWMAIESISNAKVGLPDMHYTVIDMAGNPSDVLTITPDASNSSVATMTANKAGTAIVLVTYDAMTNVPGMGGSQFSAIWPEFTGVIVVTVGADGSSIQTNMMMDRLDAASTALDAEHDILFYLGDAGASYSFKPESGCTVTVNRSVVTDKMTFGGFTGEGVTVAEDGTVTVSGLTTGRHIIKVEKNGVANYQVVTARQVSYVLQDASGNALAEDAEIRAGDTIKVQFTGLVSPAEKLSGVYNFNFSLYYFGEDDAPFRSNPGGSFGVYDFSGNPARQNITVTIPKYWAESTYTLHGAIKLGGFAAAPIGGHRDVRYATGKPVSFDATSAGMILSRLPELTIALAETDFVDGKLTFADGKGSAVARTALTVNLTDSEGNKIIVAEDGSFPCVAGEYTYTIYGAGYRYKTGSFSIGDDETSVVKRIILENSTEDTWDGITTTEPEKDGDVYVIKTGAELAWLSKQVAEKAFTTFSARLANDIDLGDYPWTAINTSSFSYVFTLDGANHEIRGLNAGKGLFGTVGGATEIKDLTVSGVLNAANGSVGTITGYLQSGTIRNCVSNVTIKAAGSSNSSIGGIAGYMGNAKIINCVNKGTITAEGRQVGGIVGSTVNDAAEVSGCYNTGAISAASEVGGILGSSNYSSTVSNCYNTGAITGSGANVGGVIGQSAGNASSCYNVGTVTGGKGFAGSIGNADKCYALSDDDAAQVLNETAMKSADLDPEAFGPTCDGYPALRWQTGVAFHEPASEAQSVLPPTCTEKGYSTYLCTKCNNSFRKDYQDPLDHDFCEHEGVPENCTDCVYTAPGCVTEGSIVHTCRRDGCAVTKTDVIPATGHTPSVDSTQTFPAYRTYTCAVCGAQNIVEWNDPRLAYVTLTGTGISTITMEDVGEYPWAYNEETARMESSNKGVKSSSSTTKIIFTLTAEGTLRFSYGVSSERNYDKLTISLGEEKLADGISGETTGSFERKLEAGTYQLTLSYAKDSSGNSYDDIGWISGLCVETETVEPEIAVTPNEMYDASAATLLATEVSTGSTKGEWLMFGLARALDKEPTEAQKTAYLAAVKSYTESKINDAGQLHQHKSTDNSRIALALTALGYDPADFEGYDLLKAFGDTAWATQQGSTGTAFALLALRAADYATSNEQALIDSLLSSQNADGGWAITTGASDLDATAMVIQALAPDYENARVKDAVDKALAFLAGKMTGDGTVSNGSNPPSAETIAQILVALTELGRNPAADTQFTKNGKTLLDGLTTFYLKDRGFAHIQGGEFNQMATEQAFYALVACRRLAAEADSLYDMTVTRVTKYTVTVAPTANGRVSVDLSQAAEGAAVTVTAEPDIGYELKSLTVTDASGKSVPLTGNTFTMPAAGVTVTAVFAKTENPAADVDAAIDALTVTRADAKTQAALDEVEKAYQALTDEQKANVKNADKLTALRQTFDRLLASAKQAAKEDLQAWFSVLNEEDYTKENWETLQKLLLKGLSDIEKAKNTDEIDRILRAVKGTAEAIATGEQLTVTFRLIGDTQHQDGVAGHEKYVTWIPTTAYTLEPGATMYDVFVRAIADYGLSQTGASSNYVSSIKAPAVLGGYWLSEFDNGRNSGWMYTVNGLHPSVGLKDCMLKDGDRIIWHYVDDYAAEESKFTWLEAEDISPEAYAKKQEQTDTAAFTDVTQNDWFYDDVQFVVENGLFNGTSTTTFSPNAAMNRAMLVTVLYRLEGEPKVTGSSVFDDVAANQWYTDAVIWATGHAIVNGYGNGKFGPTDSITREQMAAILYRYAQYKSYGVKASNSLTHYGDYAQISPYALQALKWANAEGLINGRASTTLAPQGTATRAEVAAILHRFVKNVVKAG